MDERFEIERRFRDPVGIADNPPGSPTNDIDLDEARRRDNLLRHVVRAIRDERQPEAALAAVLTALGLVLAATGGMVLRHGADGSLPAAAGWGAKPLASSLPAIRAALARDNGVALVHGTVQFVAQAVIYRDETRGALLLWRRAEHAV
ncbi:MAG: hypothetical protein ACREEN_03690, partial [Stellaceae bacterium]